MFHSSYKYKSLEEAADLLRNALPEVCGLFSEVSKLIRLLMVSPASSVRLNSETAKDLITEHHDTEESEQCMSMSFTDCVLLT